MHHIFFYFRVWSLAEIDPSRAQSVNKESVSKPSVRDIRKCLHTQSWRLAVKGTINLVSSS